MRKVALLDNMNNNFFSLARYFRDFGIDAHLYCMPNASPHFSPQADTFTDVTTLDYIHQWPLSLNARTLISPIRSQIRRLLHQYDVIIACGRVLGQLARAGIKIDICIPYGSDLYDSPFLAWKRKPLKIALSSLIVRHYQKKGLRKAKLIITDTEYKLCGNALFALGLEAKNLSFPLVYTNDIILENYDMGIEWKDLHESDFIVFNHSRQYWISNQDGLADFEHFGGAKRNDKLIRAFARFLRSTTYKKPRLVLFKYGPDVAASKLLISNLGIERFVIWGEKSERRILLNLLSKASLATNAFREGFSDIGGCSIESLAVGVPLLTNLGTIKSNPDHPFHSAPLIHALSEEDILHVFRDYEINPAKYWEIGQQSAEWFKKNLGSSLAEKYRDIVLTLSQPSNGVRA